MKAREYAGPLGVLAAGIIGVSLLCSVSAMAMGDLRNYLPVITIQPLNIVDLAVSNLETAAALTEQAVTQFVPTETLVPTNTPSLTLTPLASETPRRFVTITPTFTRRVRPTATAVPPTKTATHIPPSRTNTPIPPTDIPPTNTPVPTATETPIPLPTDTAVPIPSDTDTPIPPPPPTDTSVPPTPEPPTNTPEPPPTASGPLAGPTDTPGP